MADDLFSQARWLDAADAENPFGVRVLNCAGIATGMRATASDPAVALRFVALRGDDGRRLIGQLPGEPFEVACALRYPVEGAGRVPDGPLRRAVAMEEKWDVYLWEGGLYFTRSWSGALAARCDARQVEQEMVVDRIVAERDLVCDDAAYATRFVDFLVKSHVCGWRVPHPLPPGMPEDPRAVALHSWSLFGKHGFAATFDDTLPFGPRGRHR